MSKHSKKVDVYLSRVELYLFEEFNVEVVYSQDASDAYYDSARVVEINNRQNKICRLHSLLHEAGHVTLRNEKHRIKFAKNFPFMRREGSSKRGDKNHRVDVIREEVLAWEKGYDISIQLDIDLDMDIWSKHRMASLQTYMEWF